MKKYQFISILLLAVAGLLLTSCSQTTIVKSGDLEIEFDKNLYSRVNSKAVNANEFDNQFQLSEFLELKNYKADDFVLKEMNKKEFTEKEFTGVETSLIGDWKKEKVSIRKIVKIKTFDKFPGLALYEVSYMNTGEHDVQVTKWVNNKHQIIDQGNDLFWSFHGSSSTERSDWVMPIKPGFYKENYMGMNQSDYGGGIPVSDVWRKDAGLAVGHAEMFPKEVSLPVEYDKYSGYASLGVEQNFKHAREFHVGDTLNTLKTFVLTHTGDYYAALSLYSEFMQFQGIKFAETEEQAFESIWCGWGYERKFTTDEIINTLPKVKELGIQWAVIDDGFQISEGDWRVDTKRFPGGSKDMKKMVDAIHANGLKAKLWWAPIAADPGSKVLEDYPDALLINEAGSPQYISWWDSYYLSPASEATIKYTKETVEMFMKDWGFDGLKMDGQHMNAVPADYNWEREIEYPEKSIEMLPELFKMVFETARKIKPNAVIENCPCGTCMSFYNMPYTNQTVSSDPLSSWQIRHKGKTYKAIMPNTAYYGDHVELSDDASDFASSFGVGAVLGTKFTWPKDNPNVRTSYLLTPEKELVWKKWFALYHEKMLSKEKYLGELYDIGFDKPETHVIEKEGAMYYAFYAKKWKGTIELRGLEKGKNFSAYDYVNDKHIAEFKGDNPFIDLEFDDYLLIVVNAIAE